MALSDTATAQLWETFRAGGGAGLIREAVELVRQELIEAEAAEAIGAGRYERSDTRVTERNGHRGRLLATEAGDLELKIPKLRKGSFFPSVLEPRRRIDRALYAVIMEAYVAAVPGVFARQGPHRCAPGDLRRPPRARRSRRASLPGRRTPAMPGAFRPEPARSGAQDTPAQWQAWPLPSSPFHRILRNGQQRTSGVDLTDQSTWTRDTPTSHP